MPAPNATRRPCGGASAMGFSGEISTTEDSAITVNEQAVVRCAGCGRRPRVPPPVAGWRDDRPVALCARCASAWRKIQVLHGLLYRGGRPGRDEAEP